MSISDTAKNITAVGGLVVMAISGFMYFQPRAEAKDLAEKASKQQVQDVQQVRADLKAAERRQQLENLRLKIQFLNSKAKLSADDRNELEFSRELVKKLQAEALQ